MRGIAGMGLTFGAIGGSLAALVAAGAAIFAPGAESELGFVVIAGTVWSTAIGVAFASVLALVGGRISFDQLSMPKVTAMGAGGGVVLAAVLVLGSLGQWTPADAMVPFIFLPVLGAGSAVASLMIARRAGPSLEAAEEDAILATADPSDARLLGDRGG